MSLEIALACAGRGWYVHPVQLTSDGQKKPYTRWLESATLEERKLRQFWRQWPDALAGVVTGEVSDLFVLDEDTLDAAKLAGFNPVTPSNPTHRQDGRHWYFSGPLDGRPVHNKVDAPHRLDFRGDGGFVVMWVAPPVGTLSPVPDDILAWARGNKATGPVATIIPEIIGEGDRDNRLTSMAGTFRRRGLTAPEIYEALSAVNTARCRPPLTDGDVRRISDSVARYDPENVPRGAALKAKDSTTQNDFALAAAEGLNDLARWRDDVQEWWTCSTGDRPGIWTRDRMRGVLRAVKGIVLAGKADATSSYIDSVVRLAKDELVTDSKDFDRFPWHLGVDGGAVNLRTGDLEVAEPDMLLTRCAPTAYLPGASRERWLEHLSRLFEGDDERVAWFQRAVGCALVGDSTFKDQVFVYLLGPSGNGKGTTMRTILSVLGQDQHAVSINPRDLTNHERHLAWMHRLRGARVAVIEEMKRWQIDVAKLKTLTGADPIGANRMRQEDETWQPTHTLFMTANHPPNFGGDTVGMRRRYRPLVTGPSLDDRELNVSWEEKLKAEASGILAWMVEGCLLWQDDGRQLPILSIMEETRDAHIDDNDPYQEWADECIKTGEGFTSRKDAIGSVNLWRARRQLPELREDKHSEFYGWLREHGAEDFRKGKTRERGFTLTVL